MITIDKDKLHEEIVGYIECELRGSDFGSNVSELVWQVCFKDETLTDKDDEAATKVYDAFYKKCMDAMIKALMKVT